MKDFIRVLKSDSRSYGNHVWIKPTEQGCRVVAANDHILGWLDCAFNVPEAAIISFKQATEWWETRELPVCTSDTVLPREAMERLIVDCQVCERYMLEGLDVGRLKAAMKWAASTQDSLAVAKFQPLRNKLLCSISDEGNFIRSCELQFECECERESKVKEWSMTPGSLEKILQKNSHVTLSIGTDSRKWIISSTAIGGGHWRYYLLAETMQ